MRFRLAHMMTALAMATASCAPRNDTALGPCTVAAGGQSRLQQAETAPIDVRPQVRFFLDAESGGPLSCRPGDGACEPCAAETVDVLVGEQATLAIEVQQEGITTPLVIASVSLAADSGSEFVLLAPVPTEVLPEEAGEIFVGVTPADTAEIRATVLVETQARNQAGIPFPIELSVRGVQ